jgi:hypothetical protein
MKATPISDLFVPFSVADRIRIPDSAHFLRNYRTSSSNYSGSASVPVIDSSIYSGKPFNYFKGLNTFMKYFLRRYLARNSSCLALIAPRRFFLISSTASYNPINYWVYIENRYLTGLYGFLDIPCIIRQVPVLNFTHCFSV